MSEIGEPCGYCGTPDDGETWCCRLRYENGMDDPRRMGAWFQAEQEAATPSSGVTEGKAESGGPLLDYLEAALGIICNAHRARVDDVTEADGASPGWGEAARKWIDAYPPYKLMPEPAWTPTSDPETLARRFHEAYERLAPSFGYETREASAKPWAQVPENNRRLMIAVCREIAAQPPVPADDAAEVLAGLLRELIELEDSAAGGTTFSVRYADLRRRALGALEAAQQRLADRGQGGMPDEFQPYLAEAMKRPGFRAAYEAALREEETDDA